MGKRKGVAKKSLVELVAEAVLEDERWMSREHGDALEAASVIPETSEGAAVPTEAVEALHRGDRAERPPIEVVLRVEHEGAIAGWLVGTGAPDGDVGVVAVDARGAVVMVAEEGAENLMAFVAPNVPSLDVAALRKLFRRSRDLSADLRELASVHGPAPLADALWAAWRALPGRPETYAAELLAARVPAARRVAPFFASVGQASHWTSYLTDYSSKRAWTEGLESIVRGLVDPENLLPSMREQTEVDAGLLEDLAFALARRGCSVEVPNLRRYAEAYLHGFDGDEWAYAGADSVTGWRQALLAVWIESPLQSRLNLRPMVDADILAQTPTHVLLARLGTAFGRPVEVLRDEALSRDDLADAQEALVAHLDANLSAIADGSMRVDDALHRAVLYLGHDAWRPIVRADPDRWMRCTEALVIRRVAPEAVGAWLQLLSDEQQEAVVLAAIGERPEAVSHASLVRTPGIERRVRELSETAGDAAFFAQQVLAEWSR